jgi:hypothetical protein
MARVRQLKGDALRQAGSGRTLDCHRVKLGRNLDALDGAAEFLGEQDGRAAASGRDVEDARARPEPNTATKEEQLLRRGRVLKLVSRLGDHEVTRDHGRILVELHG